MDNVFSIKVFSINATFVFPMNKRLCGLHKCISHQRNICVSHKQSIMCFSLMYFLSEKVWRHLPPYLYISHSHEGDIRLMDVFLVDGLEKYWMVPELGMPSINKKWSNCGAEHIDIKAFGPTEKRILYLLIRNVWWTRKTETLFCI
jgi:hypothetical protein